YSIPRPDELKEENRKVVGTGAVVVGDKGKIMHGSHGAGGCRIIPEAKMQAFGKPDQKIPRVRGGHQKDWLDAVRKNQEAGSPFEYGGALTEIGLLGMIAIQRTGVRLEWDAKRMQFINDEKANQLVNPPYRTGWTL
ncbi:MAG: gfo/Idh/MocA family oxidoreductase, partial [Verrucomicrobiota bacterium]|nr:gfo/Idh/MocA family oxidoreductase [Verrucomicrobiota bacterium]